MKAIGQAELVEFRASDAGLMDQVARLRVEAWSTEVRQAAAMASWRDESDLHARHWAIVERGRAIAAARITVHATAADVADAESYGARLVGEVEPPVASLNRLVVHPAARGRGLSKVLDAVRLLDAEAMGCQSAVLTTIALARRLRQLTQVGFQSLGLGEPFRSAPLCHLPTPVVLRLVLPLGASASYVLGARLAGWSWDRSDFLHIPLASGAETS